MPSSKAQRPAVPDRRVRLLYLSLFRAVATSFLLVLLAVRTVPVADQLDEQASALYGIIAAVYVVTLVTGVLLRRGQVGNIWAHLQVAFDVLLASAVVGLTGQLESPFTFLYSLGVISAAALIGRRGAVVAALVSVASYVSLNLALRRPGDVHDQRLVVDALTQLLAQVSVAMLAGYLAELLSRTGGQLSARERDLVALRVLRDRIVSAMPSGLLTSDGAGVVTFVNPAAEQILGRRAGDVEGQPIERVLPGVHLLKGSRRAELTVPGGDRPRTLGLSVSALDADDSLLVVFQDLTEMRRLESELSRIDHLAELGRFSAQLAHEIRNPLASVRGSAQLLLSDLSGSAQERLARLIVREADRLAALVDGYLELARPPPPRLRTVRLDQVAAETVEMLRADPAAQATPIAEDLNPVEAAADPAQLKQALINLLRNALTATQGQGQGRVRVSVREGAAGPTVEVWDSAGAITEADRPHLFEPFFSRHSGGTGLGLSTVQTIVHAHGGQVEVDSAPARGTTFSLRFRPPGAGGVERDHGPDPGGR